MKEQFIEIRGAEQNNLKKINIDIPLHTFCVICGPSGSGKSSLAFETLFAEGQRRYTETLSNYAKQYIKEAVKPLIKSIKNIPPPVLLGQKNNIRSSRSTAGTLSEVMAHLSLIFSKAGHIQCPYHNTTLKQYSSSYGAKEIGKKFEKGFLLFPIKNDQKKNQSLLIRQLMKDGFFRMGQIQKKTLHIQMLNESSHFPSSFYMIFDRLHFKDIKRTEDSLRGCYEASIKYNPILRSGQALLFSSKKEMFFLSDKPVCPVCQFQFPLPLTPSLFNFNSPLGACRNCKGFGNILSIDANKVIPHPNLTLSEGAIQIFSTPATAFERRQMRAFCKEKNIDLHIPWTHLKKKEQQAIWEGNKNFCGIFGFFKMLENQRYKMHVRIFLSRYKSPKICKICNGGRVREEVKWILFQNKTIQQWSQLTFSELEKQLSLLKVSSSSPIATACTVLKRKVHLVNQIGLGYLKLNRPIRTLSGGELQRLNLSRQLGLGLSQILYILDEPTIGLHSIDTTKLISILKNLQMNNNTILTVEHDPNVIQQAQHIIEMGPASGSKGGEIIFNGSKENFLKCKSSSTNFLLKKSSKYIFPKKRKVHPQYFKHFLNLKKCHIHNLKNIEVQIPLNRMVVCTGVSGSGKSSLVVDTLYPALKKILFQKKLNHTPIKTHSLLKNIPIQNIEGFEKINKVLLIDQSSVEKNIRSFVATYTGIYTLIRDIMAQASGKKKIPAGAFSLNVEGGRCSACRGMGYQEIEMIFMDPIRLTCETCKGIKFQSEILKIRFKNKNIHEILQLTVNEAMEFFTIYPSIFNPLSILNKVGLGYLSLGQSLSTLSGGESQRLKLTKELSSSQSYGAFYILDEPSTGLHFKEINLLLKVLHQLVDQGASVLLVEHNLQVIAHCDYIIDLGPGAGEKGGSITSQEFLPDFIKNNHGATAQCLREFLN